MGLLQTIQGRLLQYDSPSRQLQQAHFDAARRLAQAQFQLADAYTLSLHDALPI